MTCPRGPTSTGERSRWPSAKGSCETATAASARGTARLVGSDQAASHGRTVNSGLSSPQPQTQSCGARHGTADSAGSSLRALRHGVIGACACHDGGNRDQTQSLVEAPSAGHAASLLGSAVSTAPVPMVCARCGLPVPRGWPCWLCRWIRTGFSTGPPGRSHEITDGSLTRTGQTVAWGALRASLLLTY